MRVRQGEWRADRSPSSRVSWFLTPGFVRRSYLAKFGDALRVVLCSGAVGAVTYVDTFSR